MKSIKNRNNKYKSKPNLQLALSGISITQLVAFSNKKFKLRDQN